MQRHLKGSGVRSRRIAFFQLQVARQVAVVQLEGVAADGLICLRRVRAAAYLVRRSCARRFHVDEHAAGIHARDIVFALATQLLHW